MCEHDETADEIAGGVAQSPGLGAARAAGARIGAADQPVVVAERWRSVASCTPAQLNLSFRGGYPLVVPFAAPRNFLSRRTRFSRRDFAGSRGRRDIYWNWCVRMRFQVGVAKEFSPARTR